MEKPSKRARRSRIDARYRRAAGEVASEEGPEKESDLDSRERGRDLEEEVPVYDIEPLLIREKKGRRVMGNRHGMFHRRQEAPVSVPVPNVLTVLVDVIATIDVNGNIIGQDTSTVGPAVPTVAAAAAGGAVVPAPSVPAVPPFPSDLTVPAVPVFPTLAVPSVPAFPFPSGVTSVQAAGVSSQPVLSSPLQPTAASTTTPQPPLSSSSANINTTISSSIPSSTLNSTSTSTSVSAPSSFSSLPSSSSSNSTSTATSSSLTSSTTEPSLTPSTTPRSTPASSATPLGGGGGGGPSNVASPPSATTTAHGGAGNSGDNAPLSAPKVAGTVIGSLAGVALILLLLLFFLRRYKQKQRGTVRLTGDGGNQRPASSSQQMTQQRGSFAPVRSSFLNRFSATSRSTAETSTTERGFQRISGRKLPSAWSAGMTSEQFARGEGTLSGSSFYKDDQGFYGGPGAKNTAATGEASGSMGTKERIMPGPARTPVIHHPEEPTDNRRPSNPFLNPSQHPTDPFMSPPQSPNPDHPPRGTLGRSHPSHDGSRGSKFTEDV